MSEDGDKGPNSRISRRNLLKATAITGSMFFIKPASAQTNNIIDSITTAEFSNSVTDTTYTGQDIQRKVYTEGAHEFPYLNDSYLVLSNGDADNIMGNPETFRSLNTGGQKIENYSPDGYVANDVATLVIDFSVPDGAQTVAFDYKFASEENPSFLNSQFQDFFETVVFPPDGEPQNIALLPDGDPVTVQNSNEYANSPEGGSQSPVQPFPSSPDTVFNSVTEKLTATWNVSDYQGQEVTMFFRVADASDRIYDSAVFIDNLRFAGDIQNDNLSRVNSALDEYEQTLFNSIESELKALSEAEAKYYKEFDTQYRENIVDYFGKKGDVVSSPSVDDEVEKVIDDAMDEGLDTTAATQLYNFYDEMYGAVSQDMSVESISDTFYNYYKGTASGQSNKLTFEFLQTGEQSIALEQDGKTVDEIIQFVQDCIIGTQSTTGLKQSIIQELSTADITASTASKIAESIEKRSNNIDSETSTSSERYENTADILTESEEFEAQITIPEASSNNSTDDNSVNSQILISGSAAIGGALLTVGAAGVKYGTIAAGASYGLSLVPAAGPAAGNAIGTVGSSIGSGISLAKTYLGGQAAANASGGLSAAQGVASSQTLLHWTRIQSMFRYLNFIDNVQTTFECGTTGFQTFFTVSQSIDSKTGSDGNLQTTDVIDFSLDSIQAENLKTENQLPDSNFARGIGSITITNEGVVPLQPDLSASKVFKTLKFIDVKVGAAHPIVFDEIPEIAPGDSATIQFEYAAPTGDFLNLISDYEIKIVEKKSNKTEKTSIQVEQFNTGLSVPTSTVADGTISTGETVKNTTTISSEADLATFSLDYDKFDCDLHIYDQNGNHVGINYTTGEVENQISGASYSGDDNGQDKQEYTTISDPSGEQYEVQVVSEEVGTVTQDVDSTIQASTNREATRQVNQTSSKSVSPMNAEPTSAGTSSYTNEVTEKTPQPAEMGITPISAGISGSGVVNSEIDINEYGSYNDLQDVSLSVDNELSKADGNASINQSNITFDQEGFSVQAGQSQSVGVSINVPSGTPSGIYQGTIEVSASSTETNSDEVTETTTVLIENKKQYVEVGGEKVPDQYVSSGSNGSSVVEPDDALKALEDYQNNDLSPEDTLSVLKAYQSTNPT